MIEYTHVKIEGPYRLVAYGQTVVCSFQPPGSMGEDEARSSSFAAVVLFVFGALLKIAWSVVAFAAAALLLLWTELCWPLLRELACLVGAALFGGMGWFLRVAGAGLGAGSRELASHSQLLHACERLRATLPRTSTTTNSNVVASAMVDSPRGARPSMLVARVGQRG